MYIQTCMHTHVHAAKCSYTNACIHLHPGMKFIKIKAIDLYEQEMSQSCDECPQRNLSSTRHIRGMLAVI